MSLSQFSLLHFCSSKESSAARDCQLLKPESLASHYLLKNVRRYLIISFTIEIQIPKAFKMNKSIILEVLDSIHRKIKSCYFFRNSIRNEIDNFLSPAIDELQREKVAILPSVANAVSWAFVPPGAWTSKFEFFFSNI